MENEVDIDSYNIPYGAHQTVSSIDIFKHAINDFRNSDIKKRSGRKQHNYFTQITNAQNKLLMDELNTRLGHHFDWRFEFHHSGEPANLHTDYAVFPWEDTKERHIVVGCIIPLDWKCIRTPYTVMYDKMSYIPRKLIYQKGDMVYQDNKEKFPYRQEFPMYDDRIMRHHPKGTEYFKTYGDLRLHSEYRWNMNKMLVFDTRRWHSSSWFTKSAIVPDVEIEYKESLVGFGQIYVPRNLRR
jgi:hypothetical protein